MSITERAQKDREGYKPNHLVTVENPDGTTRRLAVDVSGDPRGIPVFLLHGSPGTRIGPKFRPFRLHLDGIRLISYDRPGYGGSDRQKGRTVADAAGDMQAIADHLGLDKFLVIGRSGGGPHALAAAALLGDRVPGVGVLAGLSPNARTLAASPMTEENQNAYIEEEPDFSWMDTISEEFKQGNIYALLDHLRKDLKDPDQRIIADKSMLQIIIYAYKEALKNGAEPWKDDAMAIRKPWGFDLSAIPSTTEVLLSYGGLDGFTPRVHGEDLQSMIPQSELDIDPNASHFTTLEKVGDVMHELVAKTKDKFPALK